MNGGGAEREGDTESEAGSRLWTISPEPDAGLELTDREIVTWAEVGRLPTEPTQAPQASTNFKKHSYSVLKYFRQFCLLSFHSNLQFHQWLFLCMISSLICIEQQCTFSFCEYIEPVECEVNVPHQILHEIELPAHHMQHCMPEINEVPVSKRSNDQKIKCVWYSVSSL